jgi:internalin A
MDGHRIAIDRINDEKATKTGILNLTGLALESLPAELFELTHLEKLDLGYYVSGAYRLGRDVKASLGENNIAADLHRLKKLPIKSLRISQTDVDDLSSISNHPTIESIDFRITAVCDLKPLSTIKTLKDLRFDAVLISDTSPLQELPLLEKLDMSCAEFAHLEPLVRISGLKELTLDSLRVRDLNPLAGLKNLTLLYFYSDELTDVSALANLQNLESLCYANCKVAEDLSPLASLKNVRWVGMWNTSLADISAFAAMTNLEELKIWDTGVSDLGPLACLKNLKDISISGTKVTDLSPLSNIGSLQGIDCKKTKIKDVGPLSNLHNLKKLNISETCVSDISPLSNLRSLKELDLNGISLSKFPPLRLLALEDLGCRETALTDLAGLENSELPSLETLSLANTKISDLTPLRKLTSLKKLYIYRTNVTDLGPLTTLQNLEVLSCGDTNINDLSPLRGLDEIQQIDCGSTRVFDLTPIIDLPKLNSLDVYSSVITSPDDAWIAKSRLEELIAGPVFCNLPGEILSKNFYTNCLDSVRSHLADMEAGSEPVTNVKLFLLGNGRVGKTQIVRRLCGLEPELDPDSTHGVTVINTNLPPQSVCQESTNLNIWDFGGQDIYHGTHSLFLKSRAIFMIVWDSLSEEQAAHTYNGMEFQNFPIPYWLLYASSFGQGNSPVVLVQNKCDERWQIRKTTWLESLTVLDIKFCRQVHYSARNERGRRELNEAMQQAVEQLRETQPLQFIGAGRAEVRRRLETLKELDAREPDADKRMHRLISRQFFLELCAEVGNISSPDQLLQYLHQCGVIFYEKELFDDQIVLDQVWALSGIYAILNREFSYQQIRENGGRFTRKQLAENVWLGYSTQEQLLFLNMMVSCGICFHHYHDRISVDGNAEYVAPDLLPDREQLVHEIDTIWGEGDSRSSLKLRVSIVFVSLIRGVICAIGKLAKDSSVYWKYGVCGLDSKTQSSFIVNFDRTNYSGLLTVDCKGRGHQELMQTLTELIEETTSGVGEVVFKQVDGDSDRAIGRDKQSDLRLRRFRDN